MTWVAGRIPFGFRVLRAIRPILRFRNTVVVTRYDDVREVFLNDQAFRVPWARKVDVITGGFPFILGMDDTPVYRDDVAALMKVVRPADIAQRLAPEVSRLAERIVAGERRSRGRRSAGAAGHLRGAGIVFRHPQSAGRRPARLGDAPVRIPVRRCRQRSGAAGRSRCAGAAPARPCPGPHRRAPRVRGKQGRRARPLPRAAGGGRAGLFRRRDPHRLDGLHRRRPAAAADGGAAGARAIAAPARRAGRRAGGGAGNDDDCLLAGYVFEAMRFDPLGPGLPRSPRASGIAAGTPRARRCPKGAHGLSPP